MSLDKKLIGILIAIAICVSFIPLLNWANPIPIAAASTWTKTSNPVIDDNLISGDASVIYDASAGKYKIWYTESDGPTAGVDTLIQTLLTKGGSFTTRLASHDFSTISDDDVTGIKSMIKYLADEISNDDLADLLQAVKPAIAYAESTDGIHWSASVDCTVTGTVPGANYGISSPSVIQKNNGSFEMWYTGANPDPGAIKTLLRDLYNKAEELGTANLTTLARDILQDKNIAQFFTHLKTYLGSGTAYDNFIDQIIVYDLSNALLNSGSQIGHATSNNGITWTNSVTGTFTGTGLWDQCGRSSPSVIEIGTDSYTMWYTGFNVNYLALADLLKTDPSPGTAAIENAIANATQISIGKATSINGTDWTRVNNSAFNAGSATGVLHAVMTPSVIKTGAASYEMWYTNLNMPIHSFLGLIQGDSLSDIAADINISIYHAASSDGGVSWISPAQVLAKTPGRWDAMGVGAPYVLKNGYIYSMWYTGFTSDLMLFENTLFTGLAYSFSTALNAGNSRVSIGQASLNTTPTGGGGGGTPTPTPTGPEGGINDIDSSVDDQGYFTSDVVAESEDTHAKVTIKEGVNGAINGQPLTEIIITPKPDLTGYPFSQDVNAVAMAYDFQPAGARFSEPVQISLTCKLSDLSLGSDPNLLYIAWFDTETNQWTKLATTVTIVGDVVTLTAYVDHFTVFSIFEPLVAVVTPTTPSATSIPTGTTAETTPATSVITPPTKPVTTPPQSSTQPPPIKPDNTWWIITIITVVVVVVIAVILILKRRRKV
jgi:predicted GH43/DUF377 family glycosyl hydrolase